VPLTFAAILPHGSEAIPALRGPDGAAFEPVADKLREAGRLFSAHPASIVVVATPHGTRVEGQVAVSASERTEGVVEDHGHALRFAYPVDAGFARQLARLAGERGIPTALLGYGASSGPWNCLPLDWGAAVPLYFLLGPAAETTRVVLVVPSRQLSFEMLASFGEAVADAAAATPEPVAFIASADQSHAHRDDGPYGYHPAARQLDARIEAAVAADRLEDLLTVDPALIRDGKPDSLWQIAILAGLRRRVTLTPRYLGYDVPTYFGMLSAVYLAP
jgi:aromatic ring-opening dioxygenase LigB subunit